MCIAVCPSCERPSEVDAPERPRPAQAPGDGDPLPAPAPAPPRESGEPEVAPGTWFQEVALSRGLDFRMKYLPEEQGENFKINLYDHGCGVAVGDIDGDGRDDVFFCNQLGPCALFRNIGDGRFSEVTKDAGDLATTLDGKICVMAAFGDVDGDGDRDLFVTTTRAGNALFLNDGDGRFRDVTKESGVELVMESETPCFFDMDADGDLDLLVTNTARWTIETYDPAQRYWRGKSTLTALIASRKESNVLYENDGTGHFRDVTDARGMKGKGWGGDVAVFDCDADGDLDVYVGNMFGASVLYRNDGKGSFTDATREVLGRTSWGAVGAKPFDYDGDGLLDLFVVDMHSDMWTPPNATASTVEATRKYDSPMQRAIEVGYSTREAEQDFARQSDLKPDEVVFGNTLFRNLGGGRFREVSDHTGAETFWPWGIADGDFDGDGDVDAFIPSGMGFPFFYAHSPMLRNRGDGTFVDAAQQAGVDPPPGGPEMDLTFRGIRATRSSRSAATADFDGDGRLDLVVNNFNERAYYYRNVAPHGHWFELRLTGTRSNRDAIGALVRLTAGGRTQVRQVQAAGGYLAQSSTTVHFGLGDVGAIDRVEIHWPSGKVQTIEQPAVDSRKAVTEP
jgi:enediyne biosynthesis protein E4